MKSYPAVPLCDGHPPGYARADDNPKERLAQGTVWRSTLSALTDAASVRSSFSATATER